MTAPPAESRGVSVAELRRRADKLRELLAAEMARANAENQCLQKRLALTLEMIEFETKEQRRSLLALSERADELARACAQMAADLTSVRRW
jgi:hypothetical protein